MVQPIIDNSQDGHKFSHLQLLTMFQATKTDHNLCWNDRTPATTVVGKHFFDFLAFSAVNLSGGGWVLMWLVDYYPSCTHHYYSASASCTPPALTKFSNNTCTPPHSN